MATPVGSGGIGIIRVSGSKAEAIGRLVFRPRKDPCPFVSHHLYHGDIVVLETGALLDEVLITLMRAPHSFTGEDVLEIHCHGGPMILQAVLEEALKAGARLAEPGEFTRRAFLNHRLDLSQAEAVADLTAARNSRTLSMALSHLKGRLSEKVEALRASLLDLLSLLEADIDFPDEELEVLPTDSIALSMESAASEIGALLATYDQGRMFREGLKVVITGRPNVGKSSLMNVLLGAERVIVTPIPGTTRDFIEEAIRINGLAVRLTDTAGIREGGDRIEREGVERVWERLAGADVILFLLDGSEDLTGEDRDILARVRGRKVLVAVNKSDLPRRLRETVLEGVLGDTRPLWISAKKGEGIDRLKEEILLCALGKDVPAEAETMIGNLRHKVAFETAAAFLLKARENLRQGSPAELAAQDLREALQHLGEIVGASTCEEVLDRIFSRFCLGK